MISNSNQMSRESLEESFNPRLRGAGGGGGAYNRNMLSVCLLTDEPISGGGYNRTEY